MIQAQQTSNHIIGHMINHTLQPLYHLKCHTIIQVQQTF